MQEIYLFNNLLEKLRKHTGLLGLLLGRHRDKKDGD